MNQFGEGKGKGKFQAISNTPSPGVTRLIPLYLLAAWVILTGVAEVVAGIRLRKVLAGE